MDRASDHFKTVHRQVAMITNVVCCTELGFNIDLQKLTSKINNVEYNPIKFPAVIWRHKRIGGTCMMFANGKLVVNGKVSSVQEAKQRVRRYVRLIQKMGWTVTLRRITVATISAYYKLEEPVDLCKLVKHYRGSYDAELFNAAMFVKDQIHFTCFHTGTVIITGIKKEKQFYDTVIPTLIEMYLL